MPSELTKELQPIRVFKIHVRGTEGEWVRYEEVAPWIAELERLREEVKQDGRLLIEAGGEVLTLKSQLTALCEEMRTVAEEVLGLPVALMSINKEVHAILAKYREKGNETGTT